MKLREYVAKVVREHLNEQKPLTTTLKTILVFKDNELIKQLTYKTKTDAKKQFLYFQRNGILDSSTGDKIENATFELL